MKRRNLTPEEEKLWGYVTRADMPLQQRNYMPSEEQPKKIRITREYTYVPFALPYATQPSPDSKPAIAQGDYAGIDRNTADRFRKGKFTLDATIDLHGMTREKAHRILMGFIKNHYELGSRCVLVITGKGQKLAGSIDNMEYSSRGVLRELLPHWLDEPMLKPLILAFDHAKQQHGGSGAFYILLRRKR